MRGLSTRSILLNCICQVIIFFYLVDNDTSYMILLSSGVGVVIEIWKVQKGMTIRFDRAAPFPHIRLLSKTGSEEKSEEEKTDDEKEMELHAKYDAEAMTYLSYALYPLVCCYAAYSLYYDSHKSWYSFVLSVLTGCVYTFGFISQSCCPRTRFDDPTGHGQLQHACASKLHRAFAIAHSRARSFLIFFSSFSPIHGLCFLRVSVCLQ